MGGRGLPVWRSKATSLLWPVAGSYEDGSESRRNCLGRGRGREEEEEKEEVRRRRRGAAAAGRWMRMRREEAVGGAISAGVVS